MKKNYHLKTVLVIFLCQFLVIIAYAQINQPVIAYLTIQGKRTGVFKGSGGKPANKDKIECIGFRYGVSAPHDMTSGLPTGKRVHEPIVIIKNIDASSPQLLQAIYSNETLTSVLIEFFKKSPNGQSFTWYTIKLTNATIARISQYGGLGSPEKLIPNSIPEEEISLTFQKIDFENTEAKTSASDSWGAVQ